MLQLNHRNGNGMKETLNIRKELSLKLGLEIKVLLPYDTASRYRFSPTSHWNLIWKSGTSRRRIKLHGKFMLVILLLTLSAAIGSECHASNVGLEVSA